MKERERAWNSPRPKLPHVSSSINLRLPSERTRALSQPESLAHLSAGPSLSRQVSGGSLSSSGRADSPGSVHSTQSVENTEMHTEVEHIRERNWNSPQPKWRTSTRSTPSPHASSTPASAARAFRDSYRTDSPRSQSYIDQHSNSNGSALGRSASLPSNNGSSTWAPNGNAQRTKSPSLHLNSERRTPERPVSPFSQPTPRNSEPAIPPKEPMVSQYDRSSCYEQRLNFDSQVSSSSPESFRSLYRDACFGISHSTTGLPASDSLPSRQSGTVMFR